MIKNLKYNNLNLPSMVRGAPIAIISKEKTVIRKCFSGREINLRGSPSFSLVKQFELPDCMSAVPGRDNLRDNRAARLDCGACG